MPAIVQTLPPVPPLSRLGFADPAWQRWFTMLQRQLTVQVTGVSVAAPLTLTIVGGAATIGMATSAGAGTYGSASIVPVVTVDTWGRVTGVTNTAIAIASSAVSGTTTNNTAAAGIVGEYGQVLFSGVAMSTGAATNLTSLLLTPGDWTVGGGVLYTGSIANITAANAGVSITAATLGAAGDYWQTQLQMAAFQSLGAGAPAVRISASSNTTVYMVGSATFASGTVNASGKLWARRTW